MNIQEHYPHSHAGVLSNMWYRIWDPYTNYVINIDVVVVNTNSGATISQHVGSWGYKYSKVWNSNKAMCLFMHHAIARIFTTDKYPNQDTVVNHIDGNKQNNHPTNLEIVPKQHDCNHAYSSGLRTDNIPLTAFHVDNTTVHYDCNSYHELSRIIGRTPQAIHWHMQNHGSEVPYYGWYIDYLDYNRMNRNWNKSN